MSSVPVITSPTSIQRWEAASACLMDSMVAYTNSCIDLVSSPYESVSNPKDLISRIDANINSLHTEITNQLIQTRRTLAHARNKLGATCYSIPQEVLNKIFALVMLDKDGAKTPDLEGGIRMYYRQLYSLLGVCSVWDQAGRSQNELWTPIPMLSHASKWITQDAAERSLSKAGTRPLHLMGKVTQGASPEFMNILNNAHNQFETIDLTGDTFAFIHKALEGLIRPEDPHPLRELSIGCSIITHRSPPLDAFITNASAALFRRPYDIHQYLRPLRVLRLRGLYLHWQCVTPSSLVELRLQSVTFGPQPSLDHFITGLARASELRKIELISVSLYPRGTVPTQPGAVLPNLQTFHAEDVYADAIFPMFAIPAPGAYKASLHITEKSARMLNDVLDHIAIQDMDLMLYPIQNLPIPVHTLILSSSLHDGISSSNWLPHQYLSSVLEAIPSVTTLKFHDWRFLQEWASLIRPGSNSSEGHATFPRLRSLYLSKARILDSEGLKTFVSSHSLEKLVIGATILPQDGSSMLPLQHSEDLLSWLRANVPDLRVIDHAYEPPEFKSDEWQRW